MLGKNLGAAMLALFLIAACATQGPSTATSGFPLENTSWVLRDPAPPASVRAPTISFSEGRASGYAGCNQWFATVTRNEHGNLRFSAIGSTRRMCEPAAMEVESTFLAALEHAIAAEHDANAHTLRLVGDEGDDRGLFDAWQLEGR